MTRTNIKITNRKRRIEDSTAVITLRVVLDVRLQVGIADDVGAYGLVLVMLSMIDAQGAYF